MIEVQVERDGTTFVVRSVGGSAGEVVGAVDIPNLSKFYPVRVFSQREIFAIADDADARTRLLDNLVRDELDEIARQSEDLIASIRAIDVELSGRDDQLRRQADLGTEVLDLRTKLDNITRTQGDLEQWRQLLFVGSFLDNSAAVAMQWARAIELSAESIETTDLDDPAEGLPHRETLASLTIALREERVLLRRGVDEAARQSAANIQGLLGSESVLAVRAEIEAATAGYEARREELAALGVDPTAFLVYQRQLAEKTQQLEAVASTLHRLDTRRDERAALLRQLRVQWDREGQLRLEAAQHVQGSVPHTRAGRPFIDIVVEPFGDASWFREASRGFVQDRRRLTDDDWDTLIDAVLTGTPPGVSPSTTLQAWLDEVSAGTPSPGWPWALQGRETRVLGDWMDAEATTRLDLMRVPDRVSIRLYRADGSLAGELEQGLSIGQKCTAVLAVLLARDDAPVVVDQPEDDVDNEFTYRDLVPLIRSAKETRQLILTTHDPNIPVNGDAELILALEARDGRGVLKQYDGEACVGALDQLNIQLAVEDIMEGSADAFRRRFEKYGF